MRRIHQVDPGFDGSLFFDPRELLEAVIVMDGGGKKSLPNDGLIARKKFELSEKKRKRNYYK